MHERARARFPALAAALSFLFPGLGQAYAGQRWIAAVLAAPVLVLLAATSVAYLILGDRMRNEVAAHEGTLLELETARRKLEGRVAEDRVDEAARELSERGLAG